MADDTSPFAPALKPSPATLARLVKARLDMPQPLPERIMANPPDRHLSEVFRVMREDPQGTTRPLVGSAWVCLGVRVPQDIAPDTAGRVRPGQGGMSVVRDPNILIGSLKPRSLGGDGDFPLWGISPGSFPTTTRFAPSRSAHVHVEPSAEMTIDAFQAALGSTQAGWRKHD